MKHITLISDWKLKDPYVAMFKGRLISLVPDLRIWDITHSIELYNIQQTAFVLQAAYSSFPKGTLHLILTNTNHSGDSSPIMVDYDGHFFLGEDNGIFSLLLDSAIPWCAWQSKGDIKKNLTEKLAEMAGWLFSGQMESECIPYADLKRKLKYEPDYSPLEHKLKGRIVYIDSSCNAVTDIPVSLFSEIRGHRPFSARLGSGKHLHITRFHPFYDEKEDDVYLAGNRLGYLEITMYHGKIAILADIQIGDTLEITFQ